MAYDGSIRIDTSIDSKGFNAGLRNMAGGLKNLAAVIGVAFGTAAIVAFGKSAVDAASELSSAMVGLRSVVEGTGRSFPEAKKFIDEYIADGLVPVMNATAAYKNLLMRGYDTSQIQQVMNALKDSASFGRQASLTLGQAVQSATEGLKNENSILVDNAGVTKNVSLMWRDYAASIGTTAGALTKEQKIQAEVAGIMQETRFQTGDAAKLSGTYEGQVAALSVSFMNLKVAVGNMIIPIVQRVLPYIKAAIDTLVIFFNKAAQIVNLLLGTNVSLASTEAGINNIVGSTDAAATAQDKLAKSTKKSADAAKGSLAAFDELNVLQKNTTDESTIPDATSPNIPSTIDPILTEEGKGSNLDEFADKVERFKKKMLEFLQPVLDAFNRLKEALKPLGETLWSGLKWAWDNILVPLGKWTISELLPKLLDLIAAGATLLNTALVALKPLWMWFWDNVLKPAAEWTGQAIVDVLTWLTDRLNDLSKWISENPEEFQTFVDKILEIAAPVLFLWPKLYKAASDAWDWIVEKWNNAGEWFNKNVIEPIGKWFKETWDNIKKWAGDTWQNIVDKWNNAGKWFKDLGDFIWDSFLTVLDKIKFGFIDTFNGVKDFVKNSVNTIIDFVNGMINAITSGINGVINGLNSLSITIPSWVPTYGGSSWGMNIPLVSVPQIPRLATGAVIPPNAAFAAILGDQRNGRNLEAPEGLIRQIIQEEIGNIHTDVTINFSGSLAALVRELKPYVDRENTRIGSSLIRGVAT